MVHRDVVEEKIRSFTKFDFEESFVGCEGICLYWLPIL